MSDPERLTDPVESSPAAEAAEAPDVGRRSFFRQLATDAVQAAATAAGIAGALQRTAAEGAAALLNAGQPVPPDAAGAGLPFQTPPRPSFRSPFRVEPETVVILDQRRFPEEIVEVECVTGADVARVMRERMIEGAPALAQVAAFGLALSAARVRDARPYLRLATLRGTANSLGNARPGAAAVRPALARLMARYGERPHPDEDGIAIAAAMRAEADAIASQVTADHARLAEAGVAVLDQPTAGPLGVLTLGLTGPLSSGQVGTALAVIRAAHLAARELHVYVLETRPLLQGSRLTTWELAGMDLPHTVLADAAAGWLLAGGRIGAILVGAERIAGDGDVAATVGTYTLAAVARRHGVPVFVCAATTTVDLAVRDGAGLDLEPLGARELLRSGELATAPDGTAALVPSLDITPAELVTAFVTDEGVLRAPYETSLAEAVARAGIRKGLAPPATAMVGPEEP